MKRKIRQLLMLPIVGQVVCLVHIQNLESELNKERNPSFEQAKKKLHTEIRFSDWGIYEVVPKIEYWSTWKDALDHTIKVYSNGNRDVSIITHTGVKDNCYMGLWEEDYKGCSIESNSSLIASGVLELRASLPELGRYVTIINYRGVDLYFAFEVEMKK